MNELRFHIVDRDLGIVDSSNNMLELRLTCNELNERFGDAENKCEVMTTREYQVEKCIAINIETIKNDLANNDTELLYFALKGEGFTQFDNMTDEQVEAEFNDLTSNLA